MKISTLTRRWVAYLTVSLLAASTPGHAREHEDKWVEVRSPHFVVASNSGEKQARRVANQFEEIRAVFHAAFPTLHVDPGKPLLILAVKNEDSLKVLLPAYWALKDRAHPSGLYAPGWERNYAVLRTDVGTGAENPYEAIYHEYTHSILRLNFRLLPVWLDEGLAEFYGNSVVEDNEVELGRVNSRQVKFLRRSMLIPLDVLLNADHSSPLYNEKDRVSLFYAESWALVHYLMLDPEAVKQQLLHHFLKALDATDDQMEAARQAFGDLKKFTERIDSYCQQPAFYYQRIKPPAQASDKDFAVRAMTPGEALVAQGDFLLHTGHAKDARPMLDEALQMEPNLAAVHESLGYYDYLQYDNDAAEKEFAEATKLDPRDFRPFFFLAAVTYRKMGYTQPATREIFANLERAVAINPNFAPAHAFLSVAYRQFPESKPKSVNAAVRAIELEPMNMAYRVDLGNALLAMHRDEEAQTLGTNLIKTAKTPQEKAMAQGFMKRVARADQEMSRKPAEGRESPSASGDNMEAPAGTEAAQPSGKTEPVPTSEEQLASNSGTETGEIREVDCGNAPAATLTMAIPGGTLMFLVPDVSRVEYRAVGQNSTAAAIPCTEWKGRTAKVWYSPPTDEKFRGTVTAIQFF